MASPRKAVFPVAGLGTRFLPATKAVPKEMLTIVDRPLIQYAVAEAAEAGVTDFIFVTSRGKSALEDHFDRNFELEYALERKGKNALLEEVRTVLPAEATLAFVRQPAALGLGHAVWCARHLVDEEPFAVLLPDDLVLNPTGCLSQMVEVYGQVGGNLLAVQDVPREETRNYGILDVTSEEGRLARAKGMVEKPAPEEAPSTLSVIGRYILDASVMRALDGTGKGAGGEIQLTDAIAATLDEVPLTGLRFEGRRFDCGGKAGFLEANIAVALDRPDTAPLMRDILDRYL